MMSFSSLVDSLRPGMEVFIAGCAGESHAFIEALEAHPERADGVRFTGVLIPGVNRYCYADLHPNARQRVIFVNPEFRAAFARGQIEYLPLSYLGMASLLGRAHFDWCVCQAAPEHAGAGNLALCDDFVPILLARGIALAVQFNPALPRTSASHVPQAAIRAGIESTCAPVSYDAGAIDPVLQRVARQVRSLICDRQCLQLGLGKLQKAVLAQLHDLRHLSIHSGMVSSPLLALMQSGALRDGVAVTTGVALGDAALYRAVADSAQVRFAPVSYTHAWSTLSSLPNLLSINSFIEIDLTGQVNAEALGCKQVSGGGGLLDFLRGARGAPNGRGILAMPARAGERSRIVARLPAGSPVTIARNEVDIIVTEFGRAELAQKSLHERAQALLAIADPRDREALERDWFELRKEL